MRGPEGGEGSVGSGGTPKASDVTEGGPKIGKGQAIVEESEVGPNRPLPEVEVREGEVFLSRNVALPMPVGDRSHATLPPSSMAGDHAEAVWKVAGSGVASTKGICARLSVSLRRTDLRRGKADPRTARGLGWFLSVATARANICRHATRSETRVRKQDRMQAIKSSNEPLRVRVPLTGARFEEKLWTK